MQHNSLIFVLFCLKLYFTKAWDKFFQGGTRIFFQILGFLPPFSYECVCMFVSQLNHGENPVSKLYHGISQVTNDLLLSFLTFPFLIFWVSKLYTCECPFSTTISSFFSIAAIFPQASCVQKTLGRNCIDKAKRYDLFRGPRIMACLIQFIC